MQRLDALRAALHGPDAREALRAIFPQGINLRAAPDAFYLDGEGVVDMPHMENLPTDADERGLPTVRQPDEIRNPVATCVRPHRSLRATA